MTDRHSGYIITLDHDIREDDAEASVLLALQMVKGVASVQPIVTDTTELLARERVRFDVRKDLHNAIEAVFNEATP